ncbi:hypothetical protein KVT40_005606 [Elsinoe batatas]|uniref:Uncharacterized protein n=1 Tax=Elsinoe batatas TaxID=2601811 RepID=A0A8K0L2W8_9PEZI|nr:hypothetical protein KVT40_005606 [Elsinoe batatas]
MVRAIYCSTFIPWKGFVATTVSIETTEAEKIGFKGAPVAKDREAQILPVAPITTGPNHAPATTVAAGKDHCLAAETATTLAKGQGPAIGTTTVHMTQGHQSEKTVLDGTQGPLNENHVLDGTQGLQFETVVNTTKDLDREVTPTTTGAGELAPRKVTRRLRKVGRQPTERRLESQSYPRARSASLGISLARCAR